MNDCRRIRTRRGAAETALDVGCALLCAAVTAFMTAWIATAWAAGTTSPHMGLYDGAPTQGEADPSGAGRSSPVLPRNEKTEAPAGGGETQNAPEEAQTAAEARMDPGVQEYRPASILPAEAAEEAERADEGPVWEPPREEAEMIARTLWGECRGIASDTEKAAVAWCVLNRVDATGYGMGGSVAEVITFPNQFLGYSAHNPVDEHLLALSIDVMRRWYAEKQGDADAGRVLPRDYLWFVGDLKHNYFANEYGGRAWWDWSLTSPYES